MPKRLERIHYIAIVLGVVGALLVLYVAGRYAADEVTKLNFGTGREAPSMMVPVRGFIIAMGLYYLIAATSVFLPQTRRIANSALIFAGLLLIPAVLVLSAAGTQTNVLPMLSESLRLATPIALGSLAGLWSERSGVVNIAVEGMMLTGACFGFTAFFFIGPMMDSTGFALFLSVLIAILSGMVMALLHGWLSITFKTDQIVSGTVINILALGVTSFVRRQYLLNSRAGRVTLPTIEIPGLSDIPLIGPILFANKPIFFMMFVILILSHIVLFYTTWGLRTRAVGEHPKAADTVGIDVIRMRYANVLLSGMIAGLAGAWFSLETVGSFDDGMTSGKGFIALAALIFGKWTPFGAFAGSMLFGFSEALGTRFQLLNVPVPNQFLQILPYVVTVVVTSGLIGRAIPPAAVGQPYEKGH
ncbi:MAG: ABC transporter permease [Ardenticatenales bacterium]|nr:ABC transporter permease [Ardenticatenales bacterium]